MKTKAIRIFSLFLLVILCSITAWSQKKSDKPQMDAFITSLMKKMTLEEKLGQLNLVTPVSSTGPFANKNVYDKLKDGSGGNVYAIMMEPNEMHSKVMLAENSRLKIALLNGLDIIHGYKTVFPIPLGLSCSWDTTLIERTARVAAIDLYAID